MPIIHPKIMKMLKNSNGIEFDWVLVHKPTKMYFYQEGLTTSKQRALSYSTGAFGCKLLEIVEYFRKEYPSSDLLRKAPLSHFEMELKWH